LYFKQNQVSILTTEQHYHHFALSPDRKQIALSTIKDTFICDIDGNNLQKIASDYHKLNFINNNKLLLVGSNNWLKANTASYGNITLQHNVYQMPLAVYNLTNKEIVSETDVNVFLGDRWSMYYPSFADLPVDLVPFERSSDEYLIKTISPGLEAKWILTHDNNVKEYIQENAPWIPEKPYIFNKFAFEGDIQPAILKKVTYNNQEDILYLERSYAALSFPEEKNRYLSCVRIVQDILSSPSFYIETKRKLCVFDKISKTTYTLPVNIIDATHLGKISN
jgi:hypothetical protein